MLTVCSHSLLSSRIFFDFETQLPTLALPLDFPSFPTVCGSIFPCFKKSTQGDMLLASAAKESNLQMSLAMCFSSSRVEGLKWAKIYPSVIMRRNAPTRSWTRKLGDAHSVPAEWIQIRKLPLNHRNKQKRRKN